MRDGFWRAVEEATDTVMHNKSVTIPTLEKIYMYTMTSLG